jgi:hypothetical protein
VILGELQHSAKNKTIPGSIGFLGGAIMDLEPGYERLPLIDPLLEKVLF